MLKQKSIFIIAIIMSMFFIYGCNNNQDSIVLRTMGSLFFGGTLEILEDGDTFSWRAWIRSILYSAKFL